MDPPAVWLEFPQPGSMLLLHGPRQNLNRPNSCSPPPSTDDAKPAKIIYGTLLLQKWPEVLAFVDMLLYKHPKYLLQKKLEGQLPRFNDVLDRSIDLCQWDYFFQLFIDSFSLLSSNFNWRTQGQGENSLVERQVSDKKTIRILLLLAKRNWCQKRKGRIVVSKRWLIWQPFFPSESPSFFPWFLSWSFF